MENNLYERFELYVNDGYEPLLQSRRFRCGWCGNIVVSHVGLSNHMQLIPATMIGDELYSDRTDTKFYVCPQCWIATTFVDQHRQLPEPFPGESFDARNKNTDVQLVVALYNEARYALGCRASSCAVLMFRKILMHVAVERGAATDLRFIEYVDYLKDKNIVGIPQHALLDRIRDDGNQENHEIVRATPEQALELLALVALLIRSVYFVA